MLTRDLAAVIPVFHKGELVAFSANTAHHLDIGAATPGLIIDIPDVYAKGCCSPAPSSTSGATAAPRASSRMIGTPANCGEDSDFHDPSQRSLRCG